jgi:hypothetical protein
MTVRAVRGPGEATWFVWHLERPPGARGTFLPLHTHTYKPLPVVFRAIGG